MLSTETVAIIGAGFSGTLLAINILRHDGPKALLIERDQTRIARGVAYGTYRPEHLLNVRAMNMSAFPDQPGHFSNWLARSGIEAGFVPRRIYGAYLSDALRETMAEAPGRLTIVSGEAAAIDPGEREIGIGFADGSRVSADAVVLAPGNLPPHGLKQLEGLDPADGVYCPDPWAPAVTAGLGDSDTVLLIGTGLTAVDVALTLDANGFRGRILALSRRGLSPRAHDPAAPPATPVSRPHAMGAALVRHVRGRVKEIGWHAAIDELRPHTQNIWRSADVTAQKRFLRHLRPWWDVHRHRLAPAVAGKVAELEAEGRLQFAGGRIVKVAAVEGGADVTWRQRFTGAETITRVQRIVNCTGPQGDVLRTREPLLQDLAARGIIRPDPLRLGIDVDSRGRVVGSNGCPNERIFTIGPMTRGAFWEIIAVPDLRHQTWDLARWLSSAHWVGGEGL